MNQLWGWAVFIALSAPCVVLNANIVYYAFTSRMFLPDSLGDNDINLARAFVYAVSLIASIAWASLLR